MLRLGSTRSSTSSTTDRRLALPSSLPLSPLSSSFEFRQGLVAGDLNLSTTTIDGGGMSSFGQRRYPGVRDEKDEKLPAAAAAAAAAPPAHADQLLPSPRRRALDSFEPLMSMASFDDHHFFVDEQHDESHGTIIHHGRPKHDDDNDDSDDDDDDANTATSRNRTTFSTLASRKKTSSSSSTTTNHGDDDDDDDDDDDNILSDGKLPMLMADPDDENNGFSLTMCLVRQQLEFFLADQADADARRKKGGVSGNVRAGSLGFRCIHCKHLPSTERAPSADAYPNQVQLIYQAVRNFQRHHFLKCPSVPQRLKDQYQSMPRRQKSKRLVQHTNPWLFSAKRKGLSDAEDDTSKGGYRIAYNSPPSPQAVTTSSTTSSTSAVATEASSSAPSSLSSSHDVPSMYYYDAYQHGHDHEHVIGGLPPTPIQVKEPKRKKLRHS